MVMKAAISTIAANPMMALQVASGLFSAVQSIRQGAAAEASQQGSSRHQAGQGRHLQGHAPAAAASQGRGAERAR